MNAALWICGFMTLGGALAATFLGSVRQAMLALWICGLGLGGLFLSLGAEMLAVIQWIISTLGVLSFIVHSVLFGEYHGIDDRSLRKKLVTGILPVMAGAAFFVTIHLGTRGLAGAMSAAPAEAQNMAEFGRTLVSEHFLSLEVLGITLLLVVVGSGVVARHEAFMIDRREKKQ